MAEIYGVPKRNAFQFFKYKFYEMNEDLMSGMSNTMRKDRATKQWNSLDKETKSHWAKCARDYFELSKGQLPEDEAEVKLKPKPKPEDEKPHEKPHKKCNIDVVARWLKENLEFYDGPNTLKLRKCADWEVSFRQVYESYLKTEPHVSKGVFGRELTRLAPLKGQVVINKELVLMYWGVRERSSGEDLEEYEYEEDFCDEEPEVTTKVEYPAILC